ncbi:MAG: ThiF family adenylyltransferase [Lachnospiraceae bacterium]
MIQEKFIRTQMLLGSDSMEKLKNSHVIIFGVGGVGGYVTEALARSGIGTLTLVDNDTVAESNINRQIIATTKTVGKSKVQAAKERVLEINPDAVVNDCEMFYLPETAESFDFSRYDYVVDAIDTVSGKIAIVTEAKRCSTPVISSMGAGNKLDPTAFEVADIYKTSVCPLARVMRRELKKRNIDSLKVVYSKEEPLSPDSQLAGEESTPSKKRQTPGSVAFVPSVAGLIIAGEVIKDLCIL